MRIYRVLTFENWLMSVAYEVEANSPEEAEEVVMSGASPVTENYISSDIEEFQGTTLLEEI